MAKAPKAKKSKAVVVDDVPEKKAKKGKKEAPVIQGFNVRSYFDEAMDMIEKKTKISSRSLAMRGRRLSTGLLALDMYLGGGLVPGSWTTVAGGEQSCKSTTTMSIVAAAIKTKFSGSVQVFDFEGCLVGDTPIHKFTGVGTSQAVPIKSVMDGIEDPEDGKFYPVEGKIYTSEGTKKYVAARVKKNRAITKMTLVGGKSLRGHRHPIMTLNADGLLEWKLIEDLKVGDKVIRYATA